MHARFLLGPAGSGKTFRCLAEIRAELLRDPAGPPLILLAPKQATFQLERQLLADPALTGYTRLQIASFDRLAEFALGEFAALPPRLLDAEGRVMALRALLGRNQSLLQTFRATARLPGFAQQLSLLLRELQHHQFSPERLAALAKKFSAQPTLAGKLQDLALLFRGYAGWLADRHLQDADGLLELAAIAVRQAIRPAEPHLLIGGLWLDGFAEMTPQELDLLAAFLPVCDHATLAFCLPRELPEETTWLSPWSVVAQTYACCRQRISEIPFARVETELLPKAGQPTRFTGNPALARLESDWSLPPRAPSLKPQASPIRLVNCADPESEAVLAAREIRRHVRAGGRYRDVAVLVRSLNDYAGTLRRVFVRYEIPCFLDRRESVAHHPLAEMSRYALRCAAFGWSHDDWFGALKTGLVTTDDDAVDRLENLALAHGWQGNVWFQPLKIPNDASLEISAQVWLGKIMPPFVRWRSALDTAQRRPTGNQLAATLRELWNDLDVTTTLERWSAGNTKLRTPNPEIHQTVLAQMEQWLGNVELAFGDDALPLAEWLPVLESGLANLTVGVIPPALDQVLVGAIDRTRNPELQLAFVLGLNEGVFPAPPAPGPLLTDAERDALTEKKVQLGHGRYQQIGRERFYGYIACTRARQRLVLTCAAQDAAGKTLNSSPMLTQVQLLTGVELEKFESPPWSQAEHLCEVEAPLLKMPPDMALRQFPALQPLFAKYAQVQRAAAQPPLAADLVEKLFTRELRSSVSALEQFAECPFKFYASRGLRLQERVEFEFDDRDKGSFHHEVLQRFHEHIVRSGLRWRDLSIAEATALVELIAREILPQFAGGKFLADGAARFTGEILIGRLKELVAALIAWMPQYDFDPVACELAFNDEDGQLPAWRFDVGDGRKLVLRGRIDRVDLCRLDGETALAAVMDYKSRVRKLDNTRLYHGLELQLLSYLGVLKQVGSPEKLFGVKSLSPAGAFYIPLNGGSGARQSGRDEILQTGDAGRRAAYQHSGRFLGDALPHFDNRGQDKGDQFKYKLNKDGSFSKSGNEALPAAEFDALREKVETHLRDYARRIFSGELALAPYRIGSKTACDYCDFRPVCRFDPWTQPYRQLRPPPKKTDSRKASTSSLSSPKGGEGRGEEALDLPAQIPSSQPSPRLGGEKETRDGSSSATSKPPQGAAPKKRKRKS